MLINVAISGDRNVIKKKKLRILKYKDVKTEIQHMWNVKTKVIPTGTMSKSFLKHLSNVLERYKIKKLQKTVIMGTACILPKVLM
jgi:hypothetical protein